MQVVNLSLSTGKREHFSTFHERVDEAYFANVHLVCAVNISTNTTIAATTHRRRCLGGPSGPGPVPAGRA
jgi:hypothetical protein